MDLCRELGLELLEPGARDALIWTERGLVPLPESALGVPTDLDEIVRWPGLSRRGRARALTELVRKPRPPKADESIGSLVRRRMGDEVAERLTGPLLGGLFAGDVDRLSVDATFPELARWERAFGSLIRGARAAVKAATDAGPMFLRPEGGVGELPRALLGSVGPARVRVGTPARAIERERGSFAVRTDRDSVSAEAVVLAVAGVRREPSSSAGSTSRGPRAWPRSRTRAPASCTWSTRRARPTRCPRRPGSSCRAAARR